MHESYAFTKRQSRWGKMLCHGIMETTIHPKYGDEPASEHTHPREQKSFSGHCQTDIIAEQQGMLGRRRRDPPEAQESFHMLVLRSRSHT